MRGFRTKLFVLFGLAMTAGWTGSLVLSLRTQSTLQREMSVQYHDQVKRSLYENFRLSVFHGQVKVRDTPCLRTMHGYLVSDALLIAPSGQVLNNSDSSRSNFKIDSSTLSRWEKDCNPYLVDAGNSRNETLRVVSRMESPQLCNSCHARPQLRFLVTDVLVPHNQTDLIRIHLAGLVAMIIITTMIMMMVRNVHFRKVQSRLLVIQSALENVEHGDYRSTLPEPADRELQGLIHSINRMIGKLDEARQEALEHHDRQLLRADQLATVGELAAGVAHEIKNPVSGILGAISVIISESRSDDPLQPIFTEILTQIKRVDSAINDLLSYARPRPPRLTMVRIHDLVDSVLPLIRKQSTAGHVVLSVAGDLDTPPIEADPVQLGQVLVNLLLNGIQAMPMGGTLTLRVSVHHPADQIVLEIKDDGPGIPPEVQADVFRPFFTTKHKGTGLGLAISRRIVEAHGGELRLISQPGQGTIMAIHLPIHRNHPSSQGRSG